jgi:hypothetical protein
MWTRFLAELSDSFEWLLTSYEGLTNLILAKGPKINPKVAHYLLTISIPEDWARRPSS